MNARKLGHLASRGERGRDNERAFLRISARELPFGVNKEELLSLVGGLNGSLYIGVPVG